MVKDLIFVDPEDETPVKQFAEILGRKFEVVSEEEKLGDVLQTFKKGRGHLAIVRGIDEFEDGRDSTYSIRGIITLEEIFLFAFSRVDEDGCVYSMQEFAAFYG